jgi:hypothetical protein
MSDGLQFLVDEQIRAEDAPSLADRLRERLVAEGWIEAEPTDKCVLGGRGHRPGRLARSSYLLAPGECDYFDSLVTNGVAIEAERFTSLMYPFDVELCVCPRCDAQVDVDQLTKAIDAWVSGGVERRLSCADCGHAGHPRDWRGGGDAAQSIVFGNLVLSFYNWPPLDLSRWKRSIVDDVTRTVGRPLSVAWGRV